MSWSSVNDVAFYTLCALNRLENQKEIFDEELEYLGEDSAGLFATMRSCGPDWRSVEGEYGDRLLLHDLNDLSRFSNFSANLLKKLGYNPGKPREDFHEKIKGFEKILKNISCGLESPYSLRENQNYKIMVSFLEELEKRTHETIYHNNASDEED